MDTNERYLYPSTPGKSENLLQVPSKSWVDPPYNQTPHQNPPQYRPPDQNQFILTNAWEAPHNGTTIESKKTTNPNEQFSCYKLLQKITSAKIVFFLAGFLLCGIPLAVFVTLWMGARSNASTTVSSTVATATVSLPVQCYAYGTLSDQYRNYNNFYTGNWPPYDNAGNMVSGWYRITGLAGTQLLTTPLFSTNNCGASFPGYFNGTLPSTTGTIAIGSVCFYTGTSCGSSLAPITVINCNGYYVFYLISTIGPSYKYCTVY